MTEQDCRSCKNWQDCKFPPEWFNYAEIRWCPWQVLWLCEHADTLKAGCWPVQEGIGDTNNGNRQYKTEASFVKPEIIIGELEARLKTTGTQGKLLVAQAKAGETLETLDREAWEVLMYVKGWRRKRLRFLDWKRQRKYRQNDYKNVVKVS